MTNEEVLDIIRRCDIREGVELIPNEAYLFKRRFRHHHENTTYYEQEEIIVLVKNGIKVGGLYRMGSYDIHCIIVERYRGKHILSDFCRTGIVQEIWPENESVELCNVYTRSEYDKKRHLANLLNMKIKNEEQIEKRLSYYESKKCYG